MIPLRLNLGSGGRIDPGWVHVDRVWPSMDGGVGHDFMTSSATFLVLDIAKDVWPWEDGSVEGIVMHHVADLLTADELRGVLVKCHKKLAPHGVLRMSGADLTRGIERAVAGDYKWFAEPQVIGGWESRQGSWDDELTLGHFILQGGARKQWLPPERLVVVLRDAGFTQVQPTSFRQTSSRGRWITELDSRPDESWFMEAVK